MNQNHYDDLCRQCANIVEEAVTSLQTIGMTNESALALLMFQSAIRIRDAMKVQQTIRSIEALLVFDDDEDDDEDRTTVASRHGK